jgi:hypothetical protein
MSTIINATTTNGVVIQPDNSGSLVLQTNSGTTALTIDTSQRAAFVAGTAAAPAITTTGDTNTGIFFPAADTVAFAEGGAEAMRIDSSGNVGIGTASPNAKLNTVGIISTSGADAGFVTYRRDTNASAYTIYSPDNSLAFYGNSAATERMRIDSSGNLLFNSGYGSVATAYGCRAWINFNGTGTPAIRGSGNVSSITDNGTGDYTINFTTAMPDTNYSCVGSIKEGANTTAINSIFTPAIYATGNIRVQTNNGATPFDMVNTNVTIFR